MNKSFKKYKKIFVADKAVFVLSIVILAFLLFFIIFCLVSIKSSNIRIITRFSVFGNSHFYRDEWWNLYSILFLGIASTVINFFICARLYIIKGRKFGVFILVVSLMILLLAIITLSRILALS